MYPLDPSKNPYEQERPKPKTLGDLLKELPPVEKSKKTERGELLKYFSERLGKPIGYVAMRCKGMEVVDLYFLKSICDRYEREGNPWSKCWYGALKKTVDGKMV